MSELEHYLEDSRALDREILRAALVCSIDLNDEPQLQRLREAAWPLGDPIRDRALVRLRGLLFLRDKLDTERMWDIVSGAADERHIE